MNSYYGGKVTPTVVVKKVYVPSSVSDCLMILSLRMEGRSYIVPFSFDYRFCFVLDVLVCIPRVKSIVINQLQKQ